MREQMAITKGENDALNTIGIGTRIAYNDDYGTVLYVGKVASTEGTWLGVEWDSLERGKHNGKFNGIRYFETSHPTSGSFIRPTKIKIGRSCPVAIYEKYCNDDEKVLDENIMHLPQKYGKARTIEFVGLDKITNKQSKLDQLKEVDLSSMLIADSGPYGVLADLIPNVTDLILSHNLFTSWNVIANISKQLPHLKTLNVSQNNLPVPENPHELKSAFENLETLILNKISYNWFQVVKCAVMWPQLKYLDLWSNNITELTEISSDMFFNLQFLNLSNNPIGSWEEVSKLGKLPRLESLILENSEIPNIAFPVNSSSGAMDLFPSLKSLYLTNNSISEWRDVAELQKLQNLEKLKLKGNTVMSLETTETSHQFIIAKISSLNSLNGLTITREMRRGAELDYLKKYCEEWLQSGGHRDPELNKPNTEFLNEHPTYLKLIKEYGPPEESELKPQSSLLKNNLISVEFFCPENSNKNVKKLPATMTVGKLKNFVRRLFTSNAKDISLKVVSCKEGEPEIEMDNDLREISFYSIKSGDRIYIQ